MRYILNICTLGEVSTRYRLHYNFFAFWNEGQGFFFELCHRTSVQPWEILTEQLRSLGRLLAVVSWKQKRMITGWTRPLNLHNNRCQLRVLLTTRFSTNFACSVASRACIPLRNVIKPERRARHGARLLKMLLQRRHAKNPPWLHRDREPLEIKIPSLSPLFPPLCRCIFFAVRDSPFNYYTRGKRNGARNKLEIFGWRNKNKRRCSFNLSPCQWNTFDRSSRSQGRSQTQRKTLSYRAINFPSVHKESLFRIRRFFRGELRRREEDARSYEYTAPVRKRPRLETSSRERLFILIGYFA